MYDYTKEELKKKIIKGLPLLFSAETEAADNVTLNSFSTQRKRTVFPGSKLQPIYRRSHVSPVISRFTGNAVGFTEHRFLFDNAFIVVHFYSLISAA